jgi:hypothetical protein
MPVIRSARGLSCLSGSAIRYSYRIDRNRSIPDHWLPEARNGSFRICRCATNGPKKVANIQRFPCANTRRCTKMNKNWTKLYIIGRRRVDSVRCPRTGEWKESKQCGSLVRLSAVMMLTRVSSRRQYHYHSRRGWHPMILIGNSEFWNISAALRLTASENKSDRTSPILATKVPSQVRLAQPEPGNDLRRCS